MLTSQNVQDDNLITIQEFLSSGVYVEKEVKCQKGWIRGVCKEGHTFIRPCLCGREWCPDCGQDNGWIHRQRISREMEKIKVMKDIGHLVITFPEETWEYMKNKIYLNDITKISYEILQRLFEKCRGITFWHFSSKKKEYKTWYPHLHILIEKHFFDKNLLEIYKKRFFAWLKRYFKNNENYKIKATEINIHYDYYRNCPEGKKFHLLKYNARPTLKFYDEILEYVLYRFRRIRSFGDWKDVEKKQNEIFDKCPICKSDMVWSFVDNIYVDNRIFKVEAKSLSPPDGKWYGNYLYVGIELVNNKDMVH